MSVLLHAAKELARTCGVVFEVAYMSLTWRVADPSLFTGAAKLKSFLCNAFCFLLTPSTLFGAIAVSALILPVAAVMGIIGVITTGISACIGWIKAARECKRIEQARRDDLWEQRKPTILARTQLAIALHQNKFPKDVAALITDHVFVTAKKNEIPTVAEKGLFAKHNRNEIVNTAYAIAANRMRG